VRATGKTDARSSGSGDSYGLLLAFFSGLLVSERLFGGFQTFQTSRLRLHRRICSIREPRG